ncbi:PAS domain S-box-containing protein [Archangium gephyra]|uniref:histidine kinase n=1 Tax=Archangium gephyra TaxID=48 RepID=A0AAC8QI87_9BACT|nr:ATP-binding protein [Archangium gephyra]AKJ08182.1 Chemotaxis protein methyltransferase CheR [Archangium gephyra]REG29915.1 PAS domain S-box-containing protein [Archangium gephyra]
MTRVTARPAVLLVDDHPSNLQALEGVLEPLQVRTTQATSGEQALKCLLREDFAVIILDARMPGMDGFETARLIRQRARHRDTPIILISAYHQDESSIIQGYVEGAVDYLAKPFEPEVLRAKVGLFVGLFEKDRELKERAARLREAQAELLAREHAALLEAAVQRARLHGVFTQAPVAIALLQGPTHVYTYANPLYLRLVGRRDILGKPAREAHPEIDGQHSFELLDHVFRTGEPVTGKAIPLRLEGETGRETAFFDFVYQPLRTQEGSMEGLLVCACEVTTQMLARLKAEELSARLQRQHEALQKSEERFRSLAHAVSQIVWTTDAEGRVAVDSPHWRAFTGQPLEKYFDGRYGWLECIHPEDRSRTVRAWVEALRLRKVFELEHRVRRHDGKYRHMSVRGVPVVTEDGRVREWVGIHIDITEQRRSEASASFLARASALLSTSLDYEATLAHVARLVVPTLADWCAVDLLSADGGLERVAAAHHEPEKVGLVHEVLRHFELDWNAPRGLPKVLRTGETEWLPTVPEFFFDAGARDEHQTRLLHELGLGSYLCVPLLSRGRILGALTLVYAREGREYEEWELRLAEDLARRAASSVDNARLFREAKEAVQVRDEFLSIASHELKTPLTPLRLKLHSLRRSARTRSGDLDSGTLLEHLDVAERQVSRLSRLIDSLLDVSRIGAGKLELDWEDVDLVEVVREVVGRFEPQATKAGCRVTVSAPGPVLGRWDRLRLDQVVTNLLTNALKYGAGKPVELSVTTQAGHAVLLVHDQGIGIEPGNLSRIFERFERAVSERHYGGLGLGLYITRTIVQALGGTIEARSTPGEGSTFSVSLPGVYAEQSPRTPAL